MQMHRMKAVCEAAVLGVAGVLAGSADAATADEGIYLGTTEATTNFVPTATRQSGVVSLGPDSQLYKTGVGAWTLPVGVFAGWTPQSLYVRNGSLTLDFSDTTRREAICPTDLIKSKALFWFDASRVAEHPNLATTRTGDGGETFIDALYDARESDETCTPTTRTHAYAVAEHVFRYLNAANKTATSNNAEKILSPQLVTRNGKAAFWFGGVGSGRRMAIHRYGKTAVETTEDAVHVFAVQDSPDGFGPIFSPGFRTTGVWNGTPEASWQNFILHCDSGSKYLSNHTYFNGVRVDPLTDFPKKGFTLFECELNTYAVNVSRIYYNDSAGGNKTLAPNDDGSRATAVQLGGGDYAYELLCFNKRLTGAERQQVVDYLTRKWFPDATPSLTVVSAQGAHTTVEPAADTLMTNTLTRTSAGIIDKAGTGDLLYVRDTNDVSVQCAPVRMTAGAGSVLTQRPIPFELTPGTRLTTAFTSNATVTTCSALADGNEGRVVKSGRGSLLVRAVSNTVSTLEVAEGTLDLTPIAKPEVRNAGLLGAAGDSVYIPIPNASFEERATGDESLWGHFVVPSVTYCGWTTIDAISAAQWVYWVDTWALDGKGPDSATRSQWCLTAQPHDGNGAVALRRGGSIRTASPISLAAGVYELECWTNGRGNSTGGLYDVLLIDPETKEETLLARKVQNYTVSTGFMRDVLRFNVPEARSCYLGFRVSDERDVERITVLDDLRLRRVAVPTDDWLIPGGDFEALEGTGGTCMTSTAFRASITHPKWTLAYPADGIGKTGVKLGVGFSNRYLQSSGSPYYNDSLYPATSSMLVFFTNTTVATTTFTPPAGTWHLKATLAENGQSPDGKLTAQVTIGDATTTLGSIDPNTKILTDMTYKDASFTTDGETPVTLALSYSITKNINDGSKHAAIFVDNLRLTPLAGTSASAGPIYKWNFDTDNPVCTLQEVKTAAGGCGGDVMYPSYPQYYAYGADDISGNHGRFIRYDGSEVTSTKFSVPGTYRLSLYVGRQANLAGVNPLRVWLAKDGVTNTLAVIRTGTTWKQEESVAFRVPVAGTYLLGLSGTVPKASVGSTTVDEYGSPCQDAVFDNLTLVQTDDDELIDTDSVVPATTEIVVGACGRLNLSFYGTNTIRSLKYKNHHLSGVVTSANHPEFLSGPGAFYIEPSGMTLILR